MCINEDEFTALVEHAMGRLPPEFAELLDNIAVVVEDEPDPELLREMGLGEDEDLLGLYTGVPLSEREATYTGLPDQVVLYRLPLVRICHDRLELIREVRDTLVHELGHHFGLSDEDMPY